MKTFSAGVLFASIAVCLQTFVHASAIDSTDATFDPTRSAQAVSLLPTQSKAAAVPANDNFANAQVVSGTTFTISGDNTSSTTESNEPSLPGKVGGHSGGHSVWYQWVAPATGQFQLSAFSIGIDTTAGVFTGGNLSSLKQVAVNDDSQLYNSDALVTFQATQGTTYYFDVDSADTNFGAFTLSLVDSVWQFPTQANTVDSSPAVGNDGSIYFGSGDGAVYAVKTDGTLKWAYPTNGPVLATPGIAPSGTTHNGPVFIGSLDGVFYALDGDTGTLQWSYATWGPITGAPAIGAKGVYILSGDGYLYAFNVSGGLQWAFWIGGDTYSSPAIGSDNTIYLGSGFANTLYAINADGTQKWSFNANGAIYSSPTLSADGSIYFGTLNGDFYAVNPDGSQKWKLSLGSGSAISSSASIGSDGTLYFGSYDYNLHAVTSTGQKRWSFTMGNQVRASSPAVAANGVIYIGSYANYIYAINPDGTLNRRFATAGKVRSSPVISKGMLYIAAEDAKLYAFNISQNAATSMWPMFRFNPLHTAAPFRVINF